MARLILVCGPTGAGKTTHSLALADAIGAVRFSIDPWMQTLYARDMTELDYSWMIERVMRCYEQIWQVSEQILRLDGNVILDLGFTTREQRKGFADRAQAINIPAELHFLEAPAALRKARIEKRNQEKDPSVYSFEVTDIMFNFMEPRFEIPDEQELQHGMTLTA